MAQFDALRAGFESLNRMLTDKQQWDERHEATEADKRFNNVMLRNNLVQQEFNQNMQRKTFALQERGQDLAASKLTQSTLNQNRNYELAVQNANRDDKESAARLKNAEIQRGILSDEAELAAHQTRSIGVDISQVMSPENLSNPAVLSAVNVEYEEQGIYFDDKGIGRYTENDKPAQIQAYQMQDINNTVGGIEDRFDQTETRIKEQGAELLSNIEQTKSERNKVASSNRGVNNAVRAKYNREIHRQEGELARLSSFFTDEGQVKHFQEKADQARRRAQAAYTTGNEQKGAALQRDATAWDKRASNIVEGNTKAIAAAKKGTENYTRRWTAVHDRVEDNFFTRDAEQNIIVTPRGTARHQVAQKVVNALMAKGEIPDNEVVYQAIDAVRRVEEGLQFAVNRILTSPLSEEEKTQFILDKMTEFETEFHYLPDVQTKLEEE